MPAARSAIDDDDDGIPALAARLEHLFASVPRRDGVGLYTSARAVEELTASGVRVTAPYLRMLRKGERTNPSAKLLHAIAELFEVPMEYFFDDQVAARVDAQIARLQELQARRADLVSELEQVSSLIVEQSRGVEQPERRGE